MSLTKVNCRIHVLEGNVVGGIYTLCGQHIEDYISASKTTQHGGTGTYFFMKAYSNEYMLKKYFSTHIAGIPIKYSFCSTCVQKLIS